MSTAEISFYIKLIQDEGAKKIRVTTKLCQDSTVNLVEIISYLREIGAVYDGQSIELQEKDESFTLEGVVPLKGEDEKSSQSSGSENQSLVPLTKQIQGQMKAVQKLSKKKERQLCEILKMIKNFRKLVSAKSSKKEKNLTKIKQEVAQEMGESVQTIYYYIQDIQKGKNYMFDFKHHQLQKVSSLQHYNKNFETIVNQQIDWYRNKENMDVSEIITKSDDIIIQVKHQLSSLNHRNCCVNGQIQLNEENGDGNNPEENNEEVKKKFQQHVMLLQKQKNFNLKEQIIKILEKKIGKQVVCQLSQRSSTKSQ